MTLNYNNDFSGFNAAEFNKVFEQKIHEQNELNMKLDQERLAKLNSPGAPISIFSLSLMDIFIGIKDTLFGIIDDILTLKFSINIFTKNNRLYFLGIALMIVAVLLYLFDYLNYYEPNEKSNL